jgi:hypothetical protein
MISHDLYHVCEPNTKLFTELVSLLGSNAGLPDTEELIAKVIQRCKSVIDASASTWKEQEVLVGNGKFLRKSASFKRLASRLRAERHDHDDEQILDLVACDLVIGAAERVEARGMPKVSALCRLTELVLMML